MKFRLGDIVKSKNNKIINDIVIEIYKYGDTYKCNLKNTHISAYSHNLMLVKRSKLNYYRVIFNNYINKQKYKIKKIIYDYSPLNYRIVHKDKIEY